MGWNVEQTRNIDELCDYFPLLEESPEIFSNWLDLVTANKVMGKRTHDARIVAAMLANDITHILTLNPKDFTFTSNIIVVRPQELIASEVD